MSEKFDSEQRAHLWEYRLEIENLFFSRLNFFLLFESVLLGVVGALYSKTSQSTLLLELIALLGFCITVVWVYIQDRNKHAFEVLDKLTCENLPEYRAITDRIGKGRWPFRIKFPAILLLTYVVPGLIVLIWILFLVS